MSTDRELYAVRGPSIERLDEFLAALAPVEDAMTDDEILNAPLSELEDRLADFGLAHFKPDLEGAAVKAAPEQVVDPAFARPVEPISRPECVVAVYEMLRADRRVLLKAPSGAGKTTFLHRDLLRAPMVRDAFPRVLALDCSALRMRSMSLFSREATWAGFETDDFAFKRFMADLQGRSDDYRTQALTELMKLRFRDGGLLVLDHVERIDRSGEVDSWLARDVFPTAEKLGVAVLLAERMPSHRNSLHAMDGFTRYEMPLPSDDDIRHWLDQPMLRDAGVSVDSMADIVRMTGKRMELLRDYGAFIASGAPGGSFVRWRLRHGYMAGCDRVVRVARRYPEIMAAVLGRGGLRNLAPAKVIPVDAEAALMGTGAVVRRRNGGLALAAPLYAARLAMLARPEAIALSMARADLASLHRVNAVRSMRTYGEFALDPIRRAVSSAHDPVAAFEIWLKLLAQIGVNVNMYLRDDDNPGLWAPFHRRDALGPFDSGRSRNFARAAQTGAPVVSRIDGRIHIPVIGNHGLVCMVLVATFANAFKPGRYRGIDVDALIGLVEGMRSTLAHTAQRLAYRDERRLELRLRQRQRVATRERFHASKDLMTITCMPPATERESLLLEAGCESIAILEREGGRWFVSRFDRLKPVIGDRAAKHELSAPEWAQYVENGRMDAIAHHPSHRGVVLSGVSAMAVFPRLTGRGNPTIYLQPVPGSGRGDRVIAILFRGGGAPLDGYVQAKLSDMVPDLVAFSLA